MCAARERAHQGSQQPVQLGALLVVEHRRHSCLPTGGDPDRAVPYREALVGRFDEDAATVVRVGHAADEAGRFHPVEKATQYLVDVLPFALIGVAPEVLAGRIVLYGTNGFYQHCNCRIQLGWLNYLFAGPETHRWHHSKRPGEANSNYGNNVIVWDLLFRSFFFPAERSVGKIGLKNRDYPTDFLGQLKAPFVRGLEGSEGRA